MNKLSEYRDRAAAAAIGYGITYLLKVAVEKTAETTALERQVNAKAKEILTGHLRATDSRRKK